MAVISNSIKRVSGWQTTDGQIFNNEEKARDHQWELDFRCWCDENICRGGEWSAHMVATAILDEFNVSPKPSYSNNRAD